MAARREDASEQQLNNSDDGQVLTVRLTPELLDRIAEGVFKHHTAMFVASKRTIHLWRAFYAARHLGAELSSLPWMVEYLDRVAERVCRNVPQTDKEIAATFELDRVNRKSASDPCRDELVGAVLRWLGENPKGNLTAAFVAVAAANDVSVSKVNRAYYFFGEIWSKYSAKQCQKREIFRRNRPNHRNISEKQAKSAK